MSYQFKASHITSGNMLFPDKLEIDDEKVTFYKAKLIGHESTVIQRSAIGSVSLNAGLFFADIIIETKGGQRTIANGFTRSDAKRIQQLLIQ
ncbi:MAG: PH domain-containing protein [Paludibacteraceae bacterium]|nr:PH domain-containing protein [Paludibacteraceae bacterium]